MPRPLYEKLNLSTEVCIDYSVGQKVFDYLEKKLLDDSEIEEFVKHAGDCTFCMQTIIKWHYDEVLSDMELFEKPKSKIIH